MSFDLRKSDRFSACPGPVVVVVMDGVGVGREDNGNAVHLARTPTLDSLRVDGRYRTLRAHGTAVGLPSDDDMGNSEVRHNALGAGRIFSQGAKLVNEAIRSESLFRGATWQDLIARAHERQGALHFIGLLSDGNVHSHIAHLKAMIVHAHRQGVKRVFVHALLDGRDVPDTSALIYVDDLQAFLSEFDGAEGRAYRIASGGGRMKVTMDRYEADWEMVELGWEDPRPWRGPSLQDVPRRHRVTSRRAPGRDRSEPARVCHRRWFGTGRSDSGRRRGRVLQLSR